MTAADTAADGTFLGFDFGTRRIGVAVGSRRLGSARGLVTLTQRGQPDWEAIAQLIRDWQPEALVVGLPLTLDGQPQPVTRQAQDFMRQLEQRFGLPVHGADERMSTLEAESELRAQRASGQRRRRLTDEDTDRMAATLILEHWLGRRA